MRIIKGVALSALAVLTLGGLWSCDAGPSAVPSRDRAEARTDEPDSRAEPQDRSDVQGGRRPEGVRSAVDDVPLVDGVPMWGETRRYSAQESAERQFERNGKAFNADRLDDYVAKAHAFTSRPPKGSQTLSRPNGDTLIYDAKTNSFAVMAKSGAPKAFFKPDDGADYWQQQVDRQKNQADDPTGR